MTIFHFLLVGIGGFFGAISRYSLSQVINRRFPSRIPIATLFINLTGSLLLGFIIGAGMNKLGYLLLGTGFMGAFTTFSTFKLESVQLYTSGKKKEFFLYNFISYGFGIILAFLGMMLGREF